MQNRFWKFAMVAGLALSAGCQTQADDDFIAVERNDFGITQVAIDHDRVNGERVMTVRGFDDGGAEIATLRLRTGVVSYTWDPELPAKEYLGTELSISIENVGTATQIGPDLTRHHLDTGNPAVDELARIDVVAAALEREASILPPLHRMTGTETEYTLNTYNSVCTNSNAWEWRPTALSQCCLTTVVDVVLNPCYPYPGQCGSTGTLQSMHASIVTSTKHSIRTRNPKQGTPCRAMDGVSIGDYYGPCGWALAQSDGGTGAGWYTTIASGQCNTGQSGTAAGFGGYTSGTCAYTDCSNGTPI
jgi:hypothetical protein